MDTYGIVPHAIHRAKILRPEHGVRSFGTKRLHRAHWAFRNEQPWDGIPEEVLYLDSGWWNAPYLTSVFASRSTLLLPAIALSRHLQDTLRRNNQALQSRINGLQARVNGHLCWNRTMLTPGLPGVALLGAVSIAPCVWLALVGFRASRLLLYGPLIAILAATSILAMSYWSHAYWVPIIVLNTWIPQVLATGILRHHYRREVEMFDESAMDA